MFGRERNKKYGQKLDSYLQLFENIFARLHFYVFHAFSLKCQNITLHFLTGNCKGASMGYLSFSFYQYTRISCSKTGIKNNQ